MDFDLSTVGKPTEVDSVDSLNALESGDDGSMSDVEVEEDQEAFYAVFPHAPNLAKQHVLRPLVDALRGLLARPQHLFVALLRDRSDAAEDLDTLEQKVREYTQKQLKEAIEGGDWKRLKDFLESGSCDDDSWTSQQLKQQVDEMMVKLALYYTHLWTYTCMGAASSVFRVESTVSTLHAEWIAKMSAPPPSIPDIVPTNRAAIKLPAPEETSMYRPLRLRSQTAAAARAARATATDETPSRSDAAKADTDMEPAVEDATKAAAYRRARLARKSNEFLIAWFLHHKTNPYPSQTERTQIAKKTGLTEQQVRNWFANMRKRHWKPKAGTKTKKPRCLLDTLLRKSEPMNA